MTVNSLIIASHNYVDASNAFKAEGGESFLQERLALREDFLHVPGVFSKDQTEAIASSFEDIRVQDEIKGRLNEWKSKILAGKLTKIDSSMTPEEFISKIQTLYVKYSPLLTSPSYSAFDEAKKSTRDVFMAEYKSGKSTAEVGAALQEAGFDSEFINRAVNEWGWKAGV